MWSWEGVIGVELSLEGGGGRKGGRRRGLWLRWVDV